MPAQSVLVYLRAVDNLLSKLIKCPESKKIRISRSYFDRENSIIGKVGGFIGATEPQSDSRLHFHMLTYPSTVSPELLTQVTPSDILSNQVKSWIDRTCTIHLSESTYDWLDDLTKENRTFPRSSEMSCAFIDIDESEKEKLSKEELVQLMNEIIEIFKLNLEKKNCNTGFHKHILTYEKDGKGKFLCRLLMTRGVWSKETQPIMILRDKN